ncbi:MAG: acyl transferase [Chitinophagaceae bacterium]|nr:acyl transferase [Chitinophagaceae bacterium]MCW5929574.1 acyl transferase [Chitinophagaceae bacterium]
MFRFQYKNNPVYRQYCQLVHKNPETTGEISQIPFLPIAFFKTHRVVSAPFVPALVFESSGTTKMVSSRHYIKDPAIYTESFIKAFELFYGNPEKYCILGLLPSYLERQNSSLTFMVDALIKRSGHPSGGFYLHNHRELADTIAALEKGHQQTLLIGVTFGLLDFADAYPMPLQHTIIMETGGMKGRRKELLREEVHTKLTAAFGVQAVHSEYGMTELLSQAYSKGKGRFYCPPWMKVVIRNEDDPFEIYRDNTRAQSGIINVIDLANIYSASFIATDDAGRLYPDGSFEVLGRVDNSDIRGCSLMAI